MYLITFMFKIIKCGTDAGFNTFPYTNGHSAFA